MPLTVSELEQLAALAERAGIDLSELPTVQLAAGAVAALDHLGHGRHLVWADVAPPRW